ncbi:phage portal protein [Deferribacter abyssi]|uniref:phage portal protein n=1 Tax=Deferribacter abyssi TaxID=213806 RepID=UPI003C29CC0B
MVSFGCKIGRQYKRSYAAAKVTNSTGDWIPVNPNINDLIRSSHQMVTSRIKQLVRDFPYFARAVRNIVDFTVGVGLKLQARVKGPDNKLDRVLNQKIEDAFNFWSDEADIRGLQDFYEMQQLAKRQDVENGEFFVIFRKVNDKNRFLPFAIQLMDSKWLTSLGAKPQGKNRIDMGIEYDPATGRAVAYHFTDPDGWGKTVRIPAENMIHGFEVIDSDQIRGMSIFTPAILLAHDLDDYISAEIDAAKLASKWLAFVVSPNPGIRQATTIYGDSYERIDELENAIIEYLRPGEEIKFAASNRTANAFNPFVKFILRTVAITVGVSYELLTGDYEGINYSNLRGIRNDIIKGFKPMQRRMERQFCRKIYAKFMDFAVMSGKLNIPDYFQNRLKYLKASWLPPGIESIDPLREGKADIDQVKAKLKSPIEIIKSRGRDPEVVLDEFAEFMRMLEERGLTMEDVSTALANNPAILTDEEKGDPALIYAYGG